jgi:hypothetical protein
MPVPAGGDSAASVSQQSQAIEVVMQFWAPGKRKAAKMLNQAAAAAMIEPLEMRQMLTATVGIVAIDATATEASVTTGKFRLVRDDTDGALAVTVALSGTATDGTDYNTISTTVNFADGVGTADVTVTPKDDSSYEGAETVIMTIEESEDYTIDAEDTEATVTIADNEKPTVTLTSEDTAAQEADSEETGTFTLTRNGPTEGPLAVKVVFTGSTATNGTDYNTIATTLTIPDGEDHLDVNVVTKQDATLEGPETVKMSLAADAAYVIDGTDKTATVTIADDEKPVVKVLASDAIATEGSTTDTGKFTISRTGPTTEALTVDITVSGTATNGTDYDTINDSVTIPIGKSFVDVVVKTKADTGVELTETAILTIDEGDTYTINESATAATVTVKDDDKPTVSLTATDATASETGKNNTGKFTITRTGANHEALVVPIVLTGTATKGTDYKTLSTSITIPAGKSSKVIEIKPKDDLLLEGTETIIATLGTGAFIASSEAKTGTISLSEDEVPDVTLKVTDAVATEPTTDKGTITVTRSGPTGAALVVDLDVTGTATNGTDYTTIADSVTIPAGKSFATITVAPTDDSTLEGSETVIVTLADSANYDLDSDTSSGTVTLKDNEKPTISITATDDDSDEDSDDAIVFTISRDGGSSDALDVLYSISGTAKLGTDTNETLTGKATIAAGSLNKTISITPKNDSAFEGDETIILTLKAATAYTISADNTKDTATIVEDDKPTVSIKATDAKGKEGTTDGVVLTVSRTGVTTGALNVSLTTSGTVGAADFATALPTSVTIPAGKSFATVTVVAKDDSTYEGSETLLMSLAEDDDYAIDEANASAIGTFTDKQLPTVSVTASDAAATEEDHATGTFTFSRDAAAADELVVNYTITGTAKNGKDYVKIPKTVKIPAGESEATITVTPRTDAAIEGSETVILTITASATTYKISADHKADTVTIADEQSPTVSIEALDETVDESDTTGGRFRIWRTGAAVVGTLVVDFTLGGTAEQTTNYVLKDEDGNTISGTSVTIAAGDAYIDLYVIPVNDDDAGEDLTVSMDIAAKSTYTVDEDLNSVSLTIADDD